MPDTAAHITLDISKITVPWTVVELWSVAVNEGDLVCWASEVELSDSCSTSVVGIGFLQKRSIKLRKLHKNVF